MSNNDQTNTTMEQILSSPTGRVEETTGSGGILATLFRTILKDCKVSPIRWQMLLNNNALIQRTAARKAAKVGKAQKYLSAGNIGRELTHPKITWKVFIKGLFLLQIKKCRITIELVHSNNAKTIHSVSASINSMESNGLFEVPIVANAENESKQKEEKL